MLVSPIFGLMELISQLFLLLVEIGRVGFRFFGYVVDEPVLPQAQGRSSVAGLEVESGADLLATGRAGYGAITRDEITRFRLQAEGSGSGIEFLATFDALD